MFMTIACYHWILSIMRSVNVQMKKICPWQIGLDQNQEYLLHLLKGTEFCTILKAITIKYPTLHQNSPISPQKLQLNLYEQAHDFHPMIFAHFLNFLCNYHLHKERSCKESLVQLRQTIIQYRNIYRYYSHYETLFNICLGICHQMIGETYSARQCFLLATQMDRNNLTSAAMRLSKCIVD